MSCVALSEDEVESEKPQGNSEGYLSEECRKIEEMWRMCISGSSLFCYVYICRRTVSDLAQVVLWNEFLPITPSAENSCLLNEAG